MKNILFKYSKDRSFLTNLVLCLLSFVFLVSFSSIVYLIIKPIVSDKQIVSIISNILLAIILYLFYMKDLNKEFKTYTKDFKNNFNNSIKLYVIGFMGMVFFNLIIFYLLKDISQNENEVREMLFNSPLLTMISISLLAPFCEEIIFRKSVQPLIKNKWIYVLTCGLLFGGAHILVNILNNSFVLSDLLYILPYACLGGAFALMDYNSKTTFSSIVIHAMHNTVTAIFLLITYFGGNLL